VSTSQLRCAKTAELIEDLLGVEMTPGDQRHSCICLSPTARKPVSRGNLPIVKFREHYRSDGCGLHQITLASAFYVGEGDRS